MADLIAGQWADSAGHWYAPDGTPAYTVKGANGKERPATLRDAKTLGLLPSVSTILRMEAAPALESWKVTEAVKAAMRLERMATETDDEFISRAISESRASSSKASDRGSFLHGLLEESVRRGEYFGPDSERELIAPVLNWLAVNFGNYKWSVERSFASTLGYGGKIDLMGVNDGGGAVVVDYKFKESIAPGKRLAYDNHVTQLAAYAYGMNYPAARCINLFIHASEPGLIVPHEWTQEQAERGYHCFLHLLNLYQLRKGLR
jgi:hypothetical protein